jgi:hypothetical protein
VEFSEVILRCKTLIEEATGEEDNLTLDTTNFLDYADKVRDILLNQARTVKQTAVMREFALGLRRMRDDFEAIVRADPMVIYKPAHSVSESFHRSDATVRGLWCGNRCSKTQSGVAEIYWTMTGQHPWRSRAETPANCFVVGVNFTKYRPKVFEAKYLKGEPGNPLSPVFPDGGKWFHSYDQKTYTIQIACSECANKGTPKTCKHPKSSVILFSDMEGPDVLQGGQYALGQLDEQIQQEIYKEGRERIKTVLNSGLIITETPTKGKGFWTYKLRKLGRRKPKYPNSERCIVETFEIDQFSAGLVPHEEIYASMEEMTESEIETRIYGMHAAANELAVFDAEVLRAMRDECCPGERGVLRLPDAEDGNEEDALAAADDTTSIVFDEFKEGLLEIWEQPKPLAQYVVSADVAHGLTKGDASCADVLEFRPVGQFDYDFKQVAQYHGRLTPDNYADELFKLGLYYQPCTLVVELNGPGMVVVKRLRDLGCWFLFQDVHALQNVDDSYVQGYGVSTQAHNKPIIVSMLQNVVRSRRRRPSAIKLYSQDTLDELESYIQNPTASGRSFRFEGEDTNDDRVMSLALGVYSARTQALFDWDILNEEKRKLAHKADTRDEHTKSFWVDIHAEMAREAELRRRLAEGEL